MLSLNVIQAHQPVFVHDTAQRSAYSLSAMQDSFSLPSDNLDFAWDRLESADSLLEKLADETSIHWPTTAAWLMREARTEQVWQFLTLRQIDAHFVKILPLLGRRRPVWEYLLRAAHEMGRL